MAEDEKERARRSKREERRKREQEATGPSAESNEEARVAEPEDEDEEQEDATGLSDDDEGEDTEGGELDDADTPEGPRNRAERRRAKKAGASAEKDRNRRMREAAAHRRADRAEVEASQLGAADAMDAAMARGTDAVWKVLSANNQLIQAAVVLLAVGGLGWWAYGLLSSSTAQQAGDALFDVLAQQRGRVGKAEEDDAAFGVRSFADAAARRKAVEASAEAARSRFGGKPAGALADVALGAAQLADGKAEEARVAFVRAKGAELAKLDPDAFASAVEGEGIALEAKGDLEGALAAFRELSNLTGYRDLGEYQQARIFLRQNKKDRAKELLTRLSKDLAKARTAKVAEAAVAGSYLETSVHQLLLSLDPKAPPPPPSQYAEQRRHLRLLAQMTKLQVEAAKAKSDFEKLAANASAAATEPSPPPSALIEAALAAAAGSASAAAASAAPSAAAPSAASSGAASVPAPTGSGKAP